MRLYKVSRNLKQYSTKWDFNTQIANYAIKDLKMELGEKKDISNCANYVYHELPVRLARRVLAIQKLPFIVGVNPYIKSIYELYESSFKTVIDFPEPNDLSSRALMAEKLTLLTESHQNVIPELARGFNECGRYMTKESAQSFLDGMIHDRIGIRVIAEHFLALENSNETSIGVINTCLSPFQLISTVCNYVSQVCEINYGVAPGFIINGHVDTRIAYITVHLEYILTELLKNAMRATVEYSQRIGREEIPDLEISIAHGEKDVTIRIRDCGGGINPSILPKIFDYSFTTVDQEEDENEPIFYNETKMALQRGTGGPMAGLGFGLPMSRIYSKYFGGSLDIKTIHGYGCDVFLKIPNISVDSSNIQI